MKKRILSLLLIVILAFSLVSYALAADVRDVTADTAAFLQNTVRDPSVTQTGGDWTVIALARSGLPVPESYYQTYYSNVVAYVRQNGGVLSSVKYSEYSRVILALTAIGADPADVGGYSLLAPLGDYDKTVNQGINGAIYALLALDSGDYAMPTNPGAAVQATRDMYIDHILSRKLPDGGFANSGTVSDPDTTAMAIMALAPYVNVKDDIADAIEKGVQRLSNLQRADGGFASYDSVNSESVSQAIIALSRLSIPLDDARFVKNGNSLLDNLMTYYIPGAGFEHIHGGGTDVMATEQALCALVALGRFIDGKPPLFAMQDRISVSLPSEATGLPGKNPDVIRQPIIDPDVSFSDITGNSAAAAILALAQRGVINGYGDGTFLPDRTLSRAEFTAIVVRALGLVPKAGGGFEDVPAGVWFTGYVGAAFSYEIVNGRSETEFDPGGTITRQEAATMVARAAALCGMNTKLNDTAIRNVLSEFPDYKSVADWADGAMAFCYMNWILDRDDLTIRPADDILRSEIAQMVYNLLDAAMLL